MEKIPGFNNPRDLFHSCALFFVAACFELTAVSIFDILEMMDGIIGQGCFCESLFVGLLVFDKSVFVELKWTMGTGLAGHFLTH